MQTRNAARVFPEPVGALINVVRWVAISGQPRSWGSVGLLNRAKNQSRTRGLGHLRLLSICSTEAVIAYPVYSPQSVSADGATSGPARGDRAWHATCKGLAGLLPILLPDRQYYRCSASARGHPLKFPCVSLPLHFAVLSLQSVPISVVSFQGCSPVLAMMLERFD